MTGCLDCYAGLVVEDDGSITMCEAGSSGDLAEVVGTAARLRERERKRHFMAGAWQGGHGRGLGWVLRGKRHLDGRPGPGDSGRQAGLSWQAHQGGPEGAAAQEAHQEGAGGAKGAEALGRVGVGVGKFLLGMVARARRGVF